MPLKALDPLAGMAPKSIFGKAGFFRGEGPGLGAPGMISVGVVGRAEGVAEEGGERRLEPFSWSLEDFRMLRGATESG